MDDRAPARAPQATDSASTPMVLRIGVVMRLTGLGRSTVYRLMAEDAFPQPVRLTRRRRRSPSPAGRPRWATRRAARAGRCDRVGRRARLAAHSASTAPDR